MTVEKVGIIARSGVPVPLLGVHLHGKITGSLGDFTMLQRYRNLEKVPIEAVFVFPFPEEATVAGLTVHLPDRVLVGEIEERDAAFDQYYNAMTEGNGAFLLDQERPNVFQMNIGNLLPGAEAVVEIRFVWLAKSDGRIVRLLLPTTVSPRFTPPHLGWWKKREIARSTPVYSEKVPYGFSLELDWCMESSVTTIESPSHPIRCEIWGNMAKVSLSQTQASMDRDFILSVETKEASGPRGFVTSRKGQDHILVEFSPEVPSALLEMSARRLIFLLDCSGSMRGDSIAQAKLAIELCLRALIEGDQFQIALFGGGLAFLYDRFQEFSEKTLEKAIGQIRRIEADMGGTQLFSALEAILTSKTDEPLDLLVLTDGEVHDEDEILELVRTHAHHFRIFSFAIGAGPSEYLVKGLARQTRGVAEFIFPGERIEPKVLRQFGRIHAPIVSNVKIDWGKVPIKSSGKGLPPVYSNEPWMVVNRLSKKFSVPPDAKIVLRGKILQKEFEWNVTPKRLEENETIPLYWARSAIRALDEGKPVTRQELSPSAQKMIQISREYGILCSKTSFVAVEERSAEERAKEQSELRRVPVMITAGWHGSTRISRDVYEIPAFLRKRTSGTSRTLAPETHSPTRYSSTDPKNAGFEEILMESPTDWYLGVLVKQLPDGSFPLTEPLAALAGVSAEKLRKLALVFKELPLPRAEAVVATALVVLLLRKRAKDKEDSWAPAVKKAEKFLTKSGAQLEQGKTISDWLADILRL